MSIDNNNNERGPSVTNEPVTAPSTDYTVMDYSTAGSPLFCLLHGIWHFFPIEKQKWVPSWFCNAILYISWPKSYYGYAIICISENSKFGYFY